MSKGKKVTLLLLALALVLGLGLAAAVYAAGPGGMGHGHGFGMMNLTTDQAGKFFDLKEKFRGDTAKLRKDLMIKHMEMRDLWKAENPDEKAILAKVKEINALRDQMMEKSVAFRLEARKIAPQLAFGRGMGMGMGMGGGCGMGPGGMGHGFMGHGGMGQGGMGQGPGMAPPAAPPAKQ